MTFKGKTAEHHYRNTQTSNYSFHPYVNKLLKLLLRTILLLALFFQHLLIHRQCLLGDAVPVVVAQVVVL